MNTLIADTGWRWLAYRLAAANGNHAPLGRSMAIGMIGRIRTLA